MDPDRPRHQDKTPTPQPTEVSPGSQLAALREQVAMIAEPNGPYATLWQRYAQAPSTATDPLTLAMQQIEALYNEVTDLSRRGADTTPAWAQRVTAAVASAQNNLPLWLSQAEGEERKTAVAVPQAQGHALAVLDGLAAAHPPQVWATALKDVRGAISKGWVIGPKAELDQLTVLITKYVGEWDSMGTDGLKGASYESMQRLESLRMQIVQIVSASTDVRLQACCGPGSQFYEFIRKLAAQTCSSRDVQIFEGWWKANKRPT
jgi:hypothetical protein